MLFSERNKLINIDDILHTNDVTRELTSALSNSLYSLIRIFEMTEDYYGENESIINEFYHELSIDILNTTAINLENYPIGMAFEEISIKLKKLVIEKWYIYYDSIEFTLSFLIDKKMISEDTLQDEYITKINQRIAKYGSGYRINSNMQFSRIIDDVSMESVNKSNSSVFQQATLHIQKALLSLNNKQKPDYNSAIREAINAVESSLKEIIDDDNATLGSAVNQLPKKYPNIDVQFLKPFSEIYGRASNNGIRHANSTPNTTKVASESEAILIIVTCSAIINFLSTESEKIPN